MKNSPINLLSKFSKNLEKIIANGFNILLSKLFYYMSNNIVSIEIVQFRTL